MLQVQNKAQIGGVQLYFDLDYFDVDYFDLASLISFVALSARDLLMNITGLHLTLITFFQFSISLTASLLFGSSSFNRPLIAIPLEVFGMLFCLLGLLVYAALLQIEWKPTSPNRESDIQR